MKFKIKMMNKLAKEMKMKSKVKLQSLTPFIGIKGDNVEVYRRGLEFKSKVELPERTIRAKISTTTVDSEGDVLLPKGCDYGRYQKNPVVYWNHDYKQLPIGKITKMVIEDEYIEADIQFAETSLAEEVYTLIKGGFLNCICRSRSSTAILAPPVPGPKSACLASV